MLCFIYKRQEYYVYVSGGIEFFVETSEVEEV